MKNIFLTITGVFLIISVVSNAQDITNILAPNGSFKIKDGSSDYLTLSQSTGQVNILKTLRLENTASSSIGVIYKGTNRFLHNYGADNTFLGNNSGNFTMTGGYNTSVGSGTLISNTSGSENTAIGFSALGLNTTGSYNTAAGSLSLSKNTTGNANSAFGIGSLFWNISGSGNSAAGNVALFNNSNGQENSAMGAGALYSNSTGSWNSAFGYQSLHLNNGNSNSAFGYNSLFYNNGGNENTALGSNALYSNTTGFSNTSVGVNSSYFNTTGYANTSIGYEALFTNQSGQGNTALGYQALYSVTTGWLNTALGIGAGSSITSGDNNIIIGNNAQVPNPTLDYQIRIGNTSITYAGIQVAWTVTSDRRWKKNILFSNLGLDFINKLNPVSYIRTNDKEERTEYGLIAQEVEEVLKQEGVENSGMLTITDKGMYELRYNDLIAPMIKAIQELKNRNDVLTIKNEKLKVEKDNEVAELKIKNHNLEERLAKYEEMQSLLVKELQ